MTQIRADQAMRPARPLFTGGNNVFDTGGYRYHVFTASGSLLVARNPRVFYPLEYLIVGGGGGGGRGAANAAGSGGGGGGGGVKTGSLISNMISPVTVTIGGGGAGASAASTNGSAGSPSIFAGVQADGGGGGGGGTAGAGSGASGGGGRGVSTTGTVTQGTGTAGQGNDGGVGSNNLNSFPGSAGGGGGAGAKGRGGGPEISDDFARADAATLGANWIVVNSQAKVLNQQAFDAVGNSFAYSRFATPLIGDDAYVQMGLSTVAGAGTLYVFARMNTATTAAGLTCYGAYAQVSGAGGTIVGGVFKDIAGTVTWLYGPGAAISGVATVGDVLKLEVAGNAVKMMYNAATIYSGTDTSIPTGRYSGFGISSSLGSFGADNFASGASSAVAGSGGIGQLWPVGSASYYGGGGGGGRNDGTLASPGGSGGGGAGGAATTGAVNGTAGLANTGGGGGGGKGNGGNGGNGGSGIVIVRYRP